MKTQLTKMSSQVIQNEITRAFDYGKRVVLIIEEEPKETITEMVKHFSDSLEYDRQRMFRAVQTYICCQEGITEDQIKDKNRADEVKTPRQMVYYFCRYFYGKALSTSWLAAQYEQDHATVIHAQKAVEKMLYHRDMQYVINRYTKDLKVLLSTASLIGVGK